MKYNYRLFLLLFIFILNVKNVQSQNSVIDSLKNKLSIHLEKDSLRVDFLNELTYNYYLNNIKVDQPYLDEAEAIIEAIDYKKGEARHLFIKGSLLIRKGDFESTIHYFEDALKIYQDINFKEGISDCYDALATITRFQNNYKKAIEYCEKSLEIKEEIEDLEEVAYNLFSLGILNSFIGKYNESLQYYDRGLKLFEQEKNNRGISMILESLGAIHLKQGHYPLALKYLKKSLSLGEKSNSVGIFEVLNNIGVVYERQGHFDKSLEYYNRSLSISIKNNYKRSIVRTNLYIGNLYEKKKEYTKAFKFLNQALEKSKEINDLESVVASLNYIGSMYLSQDKLISAQECFKESLHINLELGIQSALCRSYWGLASTFLSEKKYKKALSYTLKSKEIADKLNLLSNQRDVEYLLFNIYKNTQDYKKALTSHENYKLLNDSLFNKKNIEKITQLEYQYKYDQKLDSASIRELKLTRTVISTTQDLAKSQRNSFIAIIVILIISIISGGIIFYLKLRHIKALNQNILIEQKLLRSQMTPHFIFNSLSVLQGMILNKEEKKSISYLSKFSKLLRTILENSRHKTVSLSDELSAIDSYMALQNLDVNPPYKYQLKVDVGIDQSEIKIPPMLIQPFIENAIEHAFAEKKEDKEINVQITLIKESLICIIADNGIGVNLENKKPKKDKKSLATTITSERLKMLAKDFKVQGSLTIQNRKLFGEQGTLATLVIPHKTQTI